MHLENYAHIYGRIDEDESEHNGVTMLTSDSKVELIAEWLEYIKDCDTRAAFCYLVGMSACLRHYNCKIKWKGKIRDLQFHDLSGEQLFSFTTNQNWLLFYFRPPSLRSGIFSIETLTRQFESFDQSKVGEWTIKIRCIDDVDRLSRFLGWQES